MLAALTEEVRQLRARLEKLESQKRHRADAVRIEDASLLRGLGLEVGQQTFDATELFELRQYRPGLDALLTAHGVVDTGTLGRRLRSIAKRGPVEGFAVMRCKRGRGGQVWAVVAIDV